MGVADGGERVAHALLGLPHQLVDILARDAAELLGLGLGGGDHLAAPGPGHTHDLLLLDHGMRLLLGRLAQGLRLALGVADELVARRDKALRLGDGGGQVGLDLIDDLNGLLALDDALVISERDAPGLRDHTVENVQQFDDIVVRHSTQALHFFALSSMNPMSSSGTRPLRSAP